MRRILPIWTIIGLFLFTACGEDIDSPEEKPETPEVSIVFAPLKSAADAATDPDNLATEYAILNLSIFLTDASSNTVTDKFIHQSFTSLTDTSIMNCKLVTLPLDPATIPAKDIYVIANFDDTNSMSAVRTLDDLKALQTPAINSPNILTTERGLPMYGETFNVDFTKTTDTPPSVMLIRTCAKIRVKLLFPDATWVGTDNKFAIENAPKYTYFVKNPNFTIPTTDLFDYPRIVFIENTPQEYVNTTYVYESTSVPRLHLYTTIAGTAKEYLADSSFPLPVRNYLYDIEIQILKPLPASSASKTGDAPNFRYKITVKN
ncbi:MAG: hypothetical protein LBO74_09275 [Candidatus Symbiothrix sp.]|jgi:hypothetical protein|nr:hypothetical protein [Candidatus Symbiothrix sp.]